MVDFTKKLAGKKVEKVGNPISLYETLDRAHDKGPLRPSQLGVLQEWNESGRAKRDVIVKLHTGQGKTLVGLLMLQARINEGGGPAVYLCPNNFLITQTCEQAKQFGVNTCQADPELPELYMNGECILVTSVQKLFNGLTKFGINRKSMKVGTLLMDDAHACADTIREACQIRIPRDEPAYQEIRALFANELEQQGTGTYADICNDKRDAMLPIPYWAWRDRESDVASILARSNERASIKFAWPLLRNMLSHCQCVVSGTSLEIEPHIAPLNAFGSFWEADHRIFMSATVTDDAFLIKGLQIKPETVLEPLVFEKENWSGEKMILLPSIIDEELDRAMLVAAFAPPSTSRKSGVVALVPAFSRTADWEAYKSKVATKDSLWEDIDSLRKGDYATTLVLANRYDGIDLPDDSCRILIFDGKPFSESLVDAYQESCRPESDATLMRIVRTVEQGMGRSVRGEKDYSVIVLLGPDLTRLLRDRHSRSYLSSQMATQIEIGLQIADLAQDEISKGRKPIDALYDLVRQCLNRDGGWKAFYVEQMGSVKTKGANKAILEMYAAELEAEQAFMSNDYVKAIKSLQTLLDGNRLDSADRGWYLQTMARYNYPANRTESVRLQLAAHGANRMVMRPPQGMTVKKLTIISQGRVERIADWIKNKEDYAQLEIALADILGRLAFQVKADKFENALDELSRALGFAGERPDKEWKEGPDNLWALDDLNYIVWECKNEVLLNRAEINKHETEQMNRSSAWFKKHYPGCKAMHIEIHPTHHVQSAAAFLDDVGIMRENELMRFTKAIRAFFKSFASQKFTDLSLPHIQNLLTQHSLTAEDLLSGSFTRKPVNLK